MFRTDPVVGDRRRRVKDWADRAFPYWTLAPMLLLLLVFSVYPMIQLVYMSFAEARFAGGTVRWTWVGLQNYTRAFGDEFFQISLRNTLIFVAATVAVELVLGFALALAVRKGRRGSKFYRTFLLLPILIPPVAIGTMWRLIYDANFGLINILLMRWGMPIQTWLSDAGTALAAVIAVDIWHWTPYLFVLLLAGLQGIPEELFEAARVDGASGLRELVHITLPLMRPTILVTVLFRMIHAFKVFDVVYILTGGGPGSATEVVNSYIHKVFTAQQRMGYGAALSIITILLVAVIAFGFRKWLGESGKDERV